MAYAQLDEPSVSNTLKNPAKEQGRTRQRETKPSAYDPLTTQKEPDVLHDWHRCQKYIR